MIPIKFQTKNGKFAVIRDLQSGDVREFLVYANKLSDEDTFVQLSGERIGLAEEKRFVNTRLASMEKGEGIGLVATVDDELVGSGAVDRGVKRKQHVGLLHVSIAKAFRGQGIGEALVRALIAESKNSLHLRLLTLTCFAINTPAIALYTKVGFQKSGEIPGAYAFKGSYQSEVTMYLPL